MSSELPPLLIKDLGLTDYRPVWQAMSWFTDARDAATPDEMWLLEHRRVFTQGQAGKPEHVLAPGDIPVIAVDRGGQVTYHGPGQIVCYPLLDIGRKGLGVKTLVSGIEQAIIDVLAEYDVAGERMENAPGIYVDGAKIASLGLRVRKGRSFHGLAFNIAMDLEPFNRINPCGFAGMPVTQLSAFRAVSCDEVKPLLIRHLTANLGYNAKPADAPVGFAA